MKNTSQELTQEIISIIPKLSEVKLRRLAGFVQRLSAEPDQEDHTLEAAARRFYHKGFIDFIYVGPTAGYVTYRDGSGDLWRSLLVIEKGRMVPKTAERVLQDTGEVRSL